MSVYEGLSETQQFACRVIADHARSAAFAIADGILPGNEGRNYVLRKIMRRAIYHGREHLGLKDLFFYKVCDFVIEQMSEAYPELEAQREFIGKMVRLEEERFGNTLTVGLDKVNSWVDENMPVTFEGFVLPFEMNSFARFYDTYGIPADLIYVVVESRVAEINNQRPVGARLNPIDFEEFNKGFDLAVKQLQNQSDIGQTERKSQISPIYSELQSEISSSTFHGYDATHVDAAEVIAMVKDDKRVDELKDGDEGLIVLSDTPFYAEAGGQVGDTGTISLKSQVASLQSEETPQASRPKTQDFAKATVIDTFAPISGIILHKSKIEHGSIKVGDTVTASVDVQKRDATRRNHTATHLVHAALREVLGTHVKQAGSVVAPSYLRFDFTHYQPINDPELTEIEDLVNRYILENQPVNTNVMAIEEAMHGGAMALFGEKYGADVRVLSVGEGTFSKELCGGTHVRATGDIGSFKITSDEAIASGVRRIRAITGFDAFERFREDERLIDRSLQALRTQRDQMPNAIEKLQEELKRTRKEIDDLKLKIATGSIGGSSSNGDEAKNINGVMVLGKIVEGLDANGSRQLSDTLLTRLKSGIVVLGRSEEGKASLIVRVSNDLTPRIKAGDIIREIAPIIGGRGGGKPDMAEGGGNLPDKLPEAIDTSLKIIENFLAG